MHSAFSKANFKAWRLIYLIDVDTCIMGSFTPACCAGTVKSKPSSRRAVVFAMLTKEGNYEKCSRNECENGSNVTKRRLGNLIHKKGAFEISPADAIDLSLVHLLVHSAPLEHGAGVPGQPAAADLGVTFGGNQHKFFFLFLARSGNCKT